MVTDQAIDSLAASATVQAESATLNVSWLFPISVGYAELTGAEVATIETGDVVLLERESAILFPNALERGWRLQPRSGNITRAVLDKYFERGYLSGKDHEHGSSLNSAAIPDLAELPVRMHAIVGEKEMTLGDAQQMIAGVIVELDGAKSDPIRIALNGKIVGAGELVEISGKLGVRILSWKAPSS
jgi:type III secretion system YscQ/HrcQ family protein